MYFKSLDNRIHWLDSAADANLLPSGSMQITDSAAQAAIEAAAAQAQVVPTIVTMRQARRALIDAGLYAAINAAVAALPGTDGDIIRVEWEFSPIVKRDSPFVAAMVTALGLTEAQLDTLFSAAVLL